VINQSDLQTTALFAQFAHSPQSGEFHNPYNDPTQVSQAVQEGHFPFTPSPSSLAQPFPQSHVTYSRRLSDPLSTPPRPPLHSHYTPSNSTQPLRRQFDLGVISPLYDESFHEIFLLMLMVIHIVSRIPHHLCFQCPLAFLL
jgi:hypothetical protein